MALQSFQLGALPAATEVAHGGWALETIRSILPAAPWPPNNSLEPPPLGSGDLRPIPASSVFGFGAILALGWPGGSPTGVLRKSRGR